jgi:cytochrome c oxidase assembly factor CtaG
MMNWLIRFWHFNPVMILFMAILCLIYFYFNRLKHGTKKGYFLTALLLLIICTCSPLQWLAEHYLFSVHMILHVTLFLIIPPLLILGIPFQKSPSVVKLSKALAAVPWLAWSAGTGIMWFWHIPDIFNATMASHLSVAGYFLYHVQDISLLVIGIIFWWPVMGPLSSYRLPALKGILYLFSACISCSLLGFIITFAPVGLYQMAMPGNMGFMSIIRNNWEITPGMDQQMAGLIMWVPGCLIYLSGALYLLREWFLDAEDMPSEETSNIILKTKHI